MEGGASAERRLDGAVRRRITLGQKQSWGPGAVFVAYETDGQTLEEYVVRVWSQPAQHIAMANTKLSIRQAMQREWRTSWETANMLYRRGVRPSKATLKAYIGTHRAISSIR